MPQSPPRPQRRTGPQGFLFGGGQGHAYTGGMSPTVFRVGNYRFHFFSREEGKVHVHVISPEGEAKFWVEPSVSLASYTGFNERQVNQLHRLIEERKGEIIRAWQNHFGL